jgi:hypothetical protein
VALAEPAIVAATRTVAVAWSFHVSAPRNDPPTAAFWSSWGSKLTMRHEAASAPSGVSTTCTLRALSSPRTSGSRMARSSTAYGRSPKLLVAASASSR